MDTTVTALERALGAEVRALATRKSLTHKEIQERADITQRSFRRYFVECSRSIPIDTVMRVAEVLGVSTADLIQAAETSVAMGGDDVRGRTDDGPTAHERIDAMDISPDEKARLHHLLDELGDDGEESGNESMFG